MSSFLTWLHVLGTIISLGSAIYFIVGCYPSVKSEEDPSQRMKQLSRLVQRFHPLFLFGICLTFMTGAMQLTSLKIGFGSQYYETFSKILMSKFGMTLVIFLIAGMQCFGMGLKFCRMVNGVIPSDLALQERYARKIKKATIMNIVCLMIAVYFGLKLLPLVYMTPTS